MADDDITWPVTMVDPAGSRIEVHSVLEAHEAAMTGGCRLERPVPGLNLASLPPATAEGPREVAMQRAPATEATAADSPAPADGQVRPADGADGETANEPRGRRSGGVRARGK